MLTFVLELPADFPAGEGVCLRQTLQAISEEEARGFAARFCGNESAEVWRTAAHATMTTPLPEARAEVRKAHLNLLDLENRDRLSPEQLTALRRAYRAYHCMKAIVDALD